MKKLKLFFTILIFLLMFYHYSINLGMGTVTGSFHFIQKNENSTVFIYVPTNK